MKAKVYKNIDDPNVTKLEILDRDRKCMLCGATHNLEVHEIVPRSAFGSRTMYKCFSPENRITLCYVCHSTAHTREVKAKLKLIMKTMYSKE